jgi:hypothetical protein
VCPYCAAVLQGETQVTNFDSLDKALYGAISQKGKEILHNPSQLSGYLMDTAPTLKKEIRIFTTHLHKDYIHYIAEAIEQDLEKGKITIEKLRYHFVEDEGLSDKSADMICTGVKGAILYLKGVGTARLTHAKVREFLPLVNKPTVSVMDTKQTKASSNPYENLYVGQRNVVFGRYEWRVLDISDNQALLLCETAIELRNYHNENDEDITWEDCDLRKYLNRDFLLSFNREERNRIVTVWNDNKDNEKFETNGGLYTYDKIFLLSIEEVIKYLDDSKMLDKFWNSKSYVLLDQYNEERKVKYGDHWVLWWLRSPGYDGSYAAVIDSDGDIDLFGERIAGDDNDDADDLASNDAVEEFFDEDNDGDDDDDEIDDIEFFEILEEDDDADSEDDEDDEDEDNEDEDDGDDESEEELTNDLEDVIGLGIYTGVRPALWISL